MAQQIINTGTAPNDGTGDTLKTSFTKTNANFTELYTRPLGNAYSASTMPPSSPNGGDFWYDLSTGILSSAVNDGNSIQWVQIVPGVQDSSGHVRADVPQSLTAAQQTQARANIYAAPLDALAFNGIQYNGSMEVNQEQAGVINLVSGTQRFIVDGWQGIFVGSGSVAVQQVAPTSIPGFVNAIQIGANVVNPSAAGNLQNLFHNIENFRWIRMAWGTVNAQPVTIGFWVFSGVTGTMAVSMRAGNATRSYVVDVPVTAVNTWQYKTVTIPGDVTGTWSAASGNSAAVVTFSFGGGTTFQTTANTWAGGNFIATPATTNFFATTTSVILTGVVLVPGMQAPSAVQSPFIMRPYADELRVCQRYFYNGVPPLRGVSVGNDAARMGAYHPVSMRAVPVLTMTAALPLFDGNTATTATGIGLNFTTATVLEATFPAAAALVAGRPMVVYQGAGGNLNVDARL